MNGMLTDDINGDGNLDILLVGNGYGSEVKHGRLDAHDGLIGLGDGAGTFDFKSAHNSGFLVQEDAKALVSLYHNQFKRTVYVASQNRGSIRAFLNAQEETPITILPDDRYAIVTCKDGRVRREKFYFGSDLISQSSRNLTWSDIYESIEIYNVEGEIRTISQ